MYATHSTVITIGDEEFVENPPATHRTIEAGDTARSGSRSLPSAATLSYMLYCMSILISLATAPWPAGSSVHFAQFPKERLEWMCTALSSWGKEPQGVSMISCTYTNRLSNDAGELFPPWSVPGEFLDLTDTPNSSSGHAFIDMCGPAFRPPRLSAPSIS